MENFIRDIANRLVEIWGNIDSTVRWAIESIAGIDVVEAIENGLNSLIEYLSGLSDAILNAIARIIGL